MNPNHITRHTFSSPVKTWHLNNVYLCAETFFNVSNSLKIDLITVSIVWIQNRREEKSQCQHHCTLCCGAGRTCYLGISAQPQKERDKTSSHLSRQSGTCIWFRGPKANEGLWKDVLEWTIPNSWKHLQGFCYRTHNKNRSIKRKKWLC